MRSDEGEDCSPIALWGVFGLSLDKSGAGQASSMCATASVADRSAVAR